MIAAGVPEARWSLVHDGQEDETRAFAADVARGLRRTPKQLSCRFLYDEEGARLFELICDLPEYTLTRAETGILERAADEIAAALPAGVTLVELGSGSSRKTRLLLEALARRQREVTYVPIDVSHAMLVESARALSAEHPRLRVAAIAAEYGAGLRRLGRVAPAPRVIAWIGSSIGNLPRAQARRFVARIRRGLDPSDRVLIGFDMRKDRAALEAAYDDAAGVSAAFNKNLLVRINRELGGTFDVDAFAHRARYRERAGRMEMHLVSLRAQRVRIRALGMALDFRRGEAVFTERSVKYAPGEIRELARAAGLRVARTWADGVDGFRLVLLAPGAT